MRLGLLSVLIATTLAGCASESDRLRSEFGATVEAKRRQIAAAVATASRLPAASRAHQQWLAAKQQFEQIARLVDADSLDETAREAWRRRLEQSQAELARLQESAWLDPPTPVAFASGEGQNAATLLLAADATPNGAEFVVRNDSRAAWYVGAPAEDDAAAARRWYGRWRSLEYVLVIRQTDARPPEHKGTDDDGRHEYKMGAFEGDAYLFRLGDADPIGGFHFLAPNERSAASFGAYELFMPEDPETAVAILADRLHDSTHRHAAATAAELSPEITAAEQVVRDLIGVRLEPID